MACFFVWANLVGQPRGAEILRETSQFFFILDVTKNNCHMNNASITKIGTVIYALVIGYFGVNHFLQGTGLQNTVPRFIPYSIFWVYLTGVLLIAAAVCFLTGKQTRLAGIAIAVFLILIVLTVHLPAVMNSSGDAPRISIAMTNMVKDTGLAGAALVIAGRGNS